MKIQIQVILLLSYITITLQAPNYINAGTVGPFTFEAGGDSADLDFMYFRITGTNPGWVAFGLGQSMKDYDVYQFPVNGSAVTCEDYHTTDFKAAIKDTGDQSCVLVKGTYENNKYTIEFKRKFTKGTSTEDQDIKCGDNKVVIAYHETSKDFTAIHSKNGSVSLKIPKEVFPKCVEASTTTTQQQTTTQKATDSSSTLFIFSVCLLVSIIALII